MSVVIIWYYGIPVHVLTKSTIALQWSQCRKQSHYLWGYRGPNHQTSKATAKKPTPQKQNETNAKEEQQNAPLTRTKSLKGNYIPVSALVLPMTLRTGQGHWNSHGKVRVQDSFISGTHTPVWKMSLKQHLKKCHHSRLSNSLKLHEACYFLVINMM